MTEDQVPAVLPKVLIVDLSLGYGGSTSRVLTLLQRSAPGSLGLACLEGASVTEHARRLGLPVHIVGKNKMDPRILFNLVRLVRSQGYEVLDSQNIQSKFWANFAAILTRTTLISTVHSWYIDEHGRDSFRGKIYTALEIFTNRALHLYITVSKKDERALLDSRIPGDDIVLIYNAVDIDPSNVKADPDWLRGKFGFPPDSIISTAVGRLVSAKNHRVLVSAMKQAVEQVPQLRCVIIGSGDHKALLEEQIRELGLEDHVCLAGYLEREEVLSIVKSSEIYVMPSRYEGTPIALLEAAALGRPILSTYAGGVPELVSDNEHALLVQPEDVDGMAAALVKLALDREYAAALGSQAQQHVRDTFSLERQVELTWQAYQKASKRHPSHRYMY
ncbi:MAG: glycosyltransferase family 4 protein [Bacteroidota bacterium]